MKYEPNPTFWNTPWQDALGICGLFESPNGISGGRILIQAICNELTDILKVDQIPSAYLPKLHIDSEFGCSYRSFWATKGEFCKKLEAPSIYIPKDFPLRALVEETAHFVLDYYQTKNKPASSKETIGHPFQNVRDVTVYEESLGRFIHSFEVFGGKMDENSEQILNSTFLTYQEALAQTLTQLYFNNEIEKEPALTAIGQERDGVFGVLLSGNWFPIAHPNHKDHIYIPNFPTDIIDQIKARDIIDVLAECEYELRLFSKSVEEYYSLLPTEMGIKFMNDFIQMIPHLRGLVTHAIGYTIGDRCADMIAKNPESISEFVKYATDPSFSLSDAVRDLVEFG